MGCGGSTPAVDESAFLQPLIFDTPSMLPCAEAVTHFAFPQGIVYAAAKRSTSLDNATVAEVVKEPLEFTLAALDGEGASGWPLKVTGYKTPCDLRLEVHDANGSGLGLIYWKGLDEGENKCAMVVFSAKPRHPEQPQAKEWSVVRVRRTSSFVAMTGQARHAAETQWPPSSAARWLRLLAATVGRLLRLLRLLGGCCHR